MNCNKIKNNARGLRCAIYRNKHTQKHTDSQLQLSLIAQHTHTYMHTFCSWSQVSVLALIEHPHLPPRDARKKG